MNIGEVVKSIFAFLFEDAAIEYFEPFFKVLQVVALSPETLMAMPFIDPMHEACQKMGVALIILLVSWHTFKIYFMGAGFETEDPMKVAVKTCIATFMCFYIKELLIETVSITNNFIALVSEAGDTAIGEDGLVALVLDLILEPSSGLYLILGIIMAGTTIVLLFKMFVRLALCAIMIVASPLAVATMVAKASEGFMQGFVKLFAGNLAIQILQTICFRACLITMTSGFDGNEIGDTFAVFLTIALMSVMNKLEDIMRDLSVSVGIGRDMQGALGKIQSAAFTISTVSNFRR